MVVVFANKIDSFTIQMSDAIFKNTSTAITTYFRVRLVPNVELVFTSNCMISIGTFSLTIILVGLNLFNFYVLRNHRNNFRYRWSSVVTSSMAIQSIHSGTTHTAAIIQSQQKQLNHRSLVRCVCVSSVFSIDRAISSVNRAVALSYTFSPYAYYFNVFNSFLSMILHSLFLLVYMRLSKLFRRKFVQIFFCRET